MTEYKLGLVLEGGASRTYYTCGILDRLLDDGIYADYVIGTSAGIANGVSYISRQRGRNYVIGTEYLPDKRYLGLRHLLNPKNKSYYNLDFIFDEIPNKLLPFDYDAFSAFRGKAVAVVTDIETGKAVYPEVSRYDRKNTVLRASCALPILFKPIEVNGKKCLDGGICDSIPVAHALQDGCKKAVVILTQPRDYRKKSDKSLELSAKLYKNYRNAANALKNRPANYNRTLDEIAKLEKEGKIFVIAPKASLGIKRTERNPEEIKRIYNMGVSDYDEIREKLINFINNP